MDSYMGSGYRNDRAKSEARAFKERNSRGFVAPGFPVEVAPPPPPPPVVGAGAAAGGAAALGVPLAFVGGVAVGLGVGLWVKSDIDRFKREAKLPFYDTDYPYRPGTGYQLSPWVPANPEERVDDWWNYEVDLPELSDDGPPLFDWWNVPGWGQTMPANGFASDGFHGPIISNGSSWVYWLLNNSPCPTQPRSQWKSCGWFPSTCGSLASNCNYTQPTCVGTVNSIPGTSTPNFYCPGDATIWASAVGVGAVSGVPSRFRTREHWTISSYAAPVNKGVGTVLLEHGFDLGDRPIAMARASVDYRPGWGEGVAPRGTQPSYEQQQVSDRMPRGKQRAGYTVPFSLAHPFTVVRVSPGTSSPVTVPDQIIDPGTDTEPGGVAIVPPGHPPDFPNAREPREGKSRSRHVIHGGFVAINVVTEAQDFLEAMHEALPKNLRSKGRKGGDVPPWVILQDIWNNWDYFDADLALENFVNNQIEDAIYGRFFGFVSRTQRRAGITVGLSRGVKPRTPWRIPGGTPEVHFANGEYGLTVGGMEIDRDPTIEIEGGYF